MGDCQNRCSDGERLRRLEAGMRGIRGVVLLLLLLAAGAFLLGARQPRVVEAEKFVFRDTQGRVRLVIVSTDEGPALIGRDLEGRTGMKVVVTPRGLFEVRMPP